MITFSTQARDDSKAIELRNHIATQAESANDQVVALLKSYDQENGLSEQESQEICHKIVSMLDSVISIEGWDDSPFLRNIMKPLQEIKQDALDFLEDSDNEAGLPVKLRELADNEQVMYMTLYQAGADKYSDWGVQLLSIRRTLLGRPVYFSEHAAQGVCRAKVDHSSDAYIVLHVNKNIVEPAKLSQGYKDQNDNDFITLEPGAITAENIVEFVYCGERYVFNEGKLQPIAS